MSHLAEQKCTTHALYSRDRLDCQYSILPFNLLSGIWLNVGADLGAMGSLCDLKLNEFIFFEDNCVLFGGCCQLFIYILHSLLKTF